ANPFPPLPAWDAAALEDRHPGRLRADRPADVRRLLHAEPGFRRTDHVDARKPDRPVLPQHVAAHDRGGADDPAVALPGRADGLLPHHRRPGDPEPRIGMSDAALPTAPVATVSLWRRTRGWITNPWGRPRFLVLITWGYMLWSIVPVLIAIQFSFNE